MIEEAIAMCPEDPMGYIQVGWVYHHDYWLGNTKSPPETINRKQINSLTNGARWV